MCQCVYARWGMCSGSYSSTGAGWRQLFSEPQRTGLSVHSQALWSIPWASSASEPHSSGIWYLNQMFLVFHALESGKDSAILPSPHWRFPSVVGADPESNTVCLRSCFRPGDISISLFYLVAITLGLGLGIETERHFHVNPVALSLSLPVLYLLG